MLLERSEIIIKDGLAEDFAEAMAAKGLPLLSEVPGATRVSLGRGVENPQKFMLLVSWDNMDSHTAFTKSAEFPLLREVMTPFSVGGAMEHFEMD